ncbi:hypothetical protein K466DRAFT_592483 [Polyporus arcularius HHB13444]|uniref:Uncharacterized protein n=1 Tax=Polyporus arcularius HHB13444 TaxID=1314778 RepID=A0A5C3NPM7_9APHY|nr:hypothetical protein K466DRAFT_592483 [Polyporus arcularius HHB13444]
MKSFAALFSAVAAVLPIVAADFVPAGSAAHFFSTQNTSLVFAPDAGSQDANLIAALPGDGSPHDITALFVTSGTGVPGQLVYADWCVTAEGVVPGSSHQTLYIVDCDPDDEAQLWTVNEAPATVSNADGNCITLGRAARGVPVTLGKCTPALLHLQTWDPKPVSG